MGWTVRLLVRNKAGRRLLQALAAPTFACGNGSAATSPFQKLSRSLAETDSIPPGSSMHSHARGIGKKFRCRSHPGRDEMLVRRLRPGLKAFIRPKAISNAVITDIQLWIASLLSQPDIPRHHASMPHSSISEHDQPLSQVHPPLRCPSWLSCCAKAGPNIRSPDTDYKHPPSSIPNIHLPSFVW